MKDYDVAAENTYNTDEKGFMLGITARSKRVFTRAIWEQNERRAAIQDGNREWISVIACICGDGSSLPPGIIYEGKAGIQSSWVCDLQPNLQEVFIAHSTSGWINNELGLAWLEQVFNRFTIDKARRRWRLLILDGHGSHVTSDFINFCDAHKILLAVFPPHSTHSLQPLDVIYSVATAPIRTSKGEFLSNFWTTWSESFRRELILKSFQATGVLPMDAQAVLKRFNKTPQQQLNGVKVGQQGDGDSWRQLRNFLDAAVEDRAKVESKRLEQSLHSLQVQNELLHHENEGLRSLLNNKKKRNNKSKVLDLQHSEEYHSGAVFWSPRKVQRARELEATKQQEASNYNSKKTTRETSKQLL
ncbi:DDE 1 domain containing protein [Pyrenophora teres f. teres]|uniref:DDE 1 domain containing protein n=1 Tax=Pyrenophora teres f. teres TaxID=97479 RepID=A0A6S6WHW3_9PLEO|nr:DDE 1 domain containing protein [Pyrenophora teres f. teres]CAE7221619.1 DDE 1 domain containing protein [Pyrenophora teres f. teres]CAE7222572.1 DDE 1 domain containing protein [Pyrenophora teres f. teres]